MVSDRTLTGIRITRSSGSPALDEAAARAFYDAEPFHAPPKMLIDKTGTVRFAFHFSFGSHPLKPGKNQLNLVWRQARP